MANFRSELPGSPGSITPQIAAEHIHVLPWPGSDAAVRAVRIDAKLWFVAADLCWALRWALSSNGKPNVTAALKGLSAEDRCSARLEVARGSLKPFTPFALTTPSGLLALVARKHQKSRGTIDAAGLHGWIAKAVAAVSAPRIDAAPPQRRAAR